MHPSLSEKSSFGIIMEHDEEKKDNGVVENVFESPKSSLSRTASEEQFSKPPTRPCPAARSTTHDLLKVDTAIANNNADLEKGLLAPQSSRSSAHSPLYEPCRVYSVNTQPQECTMWPSKRTLKTKAKQDKTHRRGSTCFGLSKKWGSLTRKQRLWIRILLVLVVIALGVGVAIGISRAVGGGVYGGKKGTQQIPGSG
ncbi:hypothetical protein K461DRAFT_289218 [Myriangium duriaei CBS 260.36]|uniref:Uncharacterized protein n=1 Tax=Myriangium duriaei CBS 260.36 TaxID=1168546 RepID=A0A9P4JA23_9PEZI|nr:hypothetical protein K461DRAFT_289218 [Myriangium duriaei CBS 260.36]